MRSFLLVAAITLSTSISYSQKADTANSTCTQAGLVIGVHSFGKQIVLKGPTGYMATVGLDERTALVKFENGHWSTMHSGGLNPADTGDLVCAVSPGEKKPASRIHIVPRDVVAARQQKFLGDWQKNSLYGDIDAVDPAGHSITVRPAGQGEPVRVVFGPDVRFRAFADDAARIQDGKPFRANELRAGQRVYVWGPRAASGHAIDARIVATGGVRATVGTITAIRPLTSTVQIRELADDRARNVKLVASQLFRTAPAIKTPTEITTPAGVPLASVGFADLGAGDSVLVIGRGDGPDIAGLIMITSFGSFGVGADDPTSQLTWVIK